MIILGVLLTMRAAAFELIRSVQVPPSEPECVRLAVADLVSDVQKITGKTLQVVDADGAVVLVSLNRPASATLLEKIAPGFGDGIKGKWEAYRVETVGDRLIIAGSDERGTIFGLYAFIEKYLGVDPLWYWASRPPKKRAKLAWDNVKINSGEPTFKFRGWFINDEDLLTGWKLSNERRRLVHYYFHLPIADEVYEKVFEAALRLRCNLIIPGSYIDLEAACDRKIVEAATRRGLFVSQHHTQPLGVSAFCFRNYWHDRGQKPEFSYTKNARAMETVWEHYARLWARYPNIIWQLGLRGAADRAFWTADLHAPKTDRERGDLISRAIARQWELVRNVTGGTPPATATLWAEGSDLHAKEHLKFPDGVAVVFADEGSTQEMQADFHTIARQPGRNYGVYYHAAFWGDGPHLVQGVSLDKIARNYAAIIGKGDTYYSILNVGNIREVILQIEAIAEITRSGADFAHDAFLRRWCARRFGEAVADDVARVYQAFFAAFVPLSEKGNRLMLDGIPRGIGKSLLATALDRDMFPAYGGRAELYKTLDRYQPLAAASARNFRAVTEQAKRTLSRISADRQPFFTDNLLVQAEIMSGLCLWLEELCKGIRAFITLDVSKAAAHAGRAADVLGGALEYRKRAEWGPWANWYRGDWRMNLPALHEDTRRLATKWTELATLERDTH